jgi:acetyl-CoA acetyltransferase
MREVVIASAVRTAVGKSGKGTLRATRPDDLAAVAIKGALDRIPQLDKKEIEDVIVAALRRKPSRNERGPHRVATRRPAGGSFGYDH